MKMLQIEKDKMKFVVVAYWYVNIEHHMHDQHYVIFINCTQNIWLSMNSQLLFWYQTEEVYKIFNTSNRLDVHCMIVKCIWFHIFQSLTIGKLYCTKMCTTEVPNEFLGNERLLNTSIQCCLADSLHWFSPHT